MTHARPASPGFGNVLKNARFLVLFGAEAQSIVGDQLARIALVLLVYRKTDSTALTAAVYALSFVPAVVGGFALSGLADRYSRTSVMIITEVLRCVLVGAMSVPGVPLYAICALLAVSVFVSPLFRAAQLATIAEIMSRSEYRIATSLRLTTMQVGQVVGLALGGIVVGAIGTRPALALDALTFAVSAAIIYFGLRSRPVASAADGVSRGPRRFTRETISLVAHSRRLRVIVALAWLAGFYVAPEGLAVPFVHHYDGSALAVGAMLAAIPLGSVVGALIVARLPNPTRILGPAAVLAGLPLLACLLNLPLLVAGLLWALSGALTAYQIEAVSLYIGEVPEAHRGRAAGLYSAGLVGVQGIGVAGFGLVGACLGPHVAVASPGCAGLSSRLLQRWLFASGTVSRRRRIGIPVVPRGRSARRRIDPRCVWRSLVRRPRCTLRASRLWVVVGGGGWWLGVPDAHCGPLGCGVVVGGGGWWLGVPDAHCGPLGCGWLWAVVAGG